MSNRDHPLAKGTSAVELAPRNPPPSHSAAIGLVAVSLAAAAYFGAGLLNSGLTTLLTPPPTSVTGASPNADPVVNLGYASYRGLLNDTVPDVISWLGVPYAQPGTPRRFRAASPIDETPREHNVTNLLEYPPFCVQSWSPWVGPDDRGGEGSEACLNLNVYAPKSATNTSSLPVLVYIHGGGYYNGNPRNWPFDNWVQRSPMPFIAVSVYYRLSALGFLAAPESPDKGVHAGEDPELLLNAGFHDQRLALRFIQSHISQFGGDPSRVTIMGQSAGAGSVGMHLVARNENPDEKLFHRAILQSWYRAPILNPVDRKGPWNHLTKHLGCTGWGWSTQRSLDCLRQVDHVKLVQAADEGMAKHFKHTDWMWQPQIDNKLFFEPPKKALLRAPLDVDIMVGHTTHDAVITGPPFSQWVHATFPKLSHKDIQKLETTYTKAGFAPDELTEIGLSEGMFACSSQFIGDIYGPRAYTYRFDEPDPIDPTRADHCADNYMLFEGTRTSSNGTNTFHPLTPSQRALSDEVIAYFAAFIATGNPNILAPPQDTPTPSIAQAVFGNAPGAQKHIPPTWPTHDTGKRLVFRAESGGTGAVKDTPGGTFIEEVDSGEVERCNVWDELADVAQI